MARIKTAEITVNGKKKIVNADDPRAQEKPKGPGRPPKPKGGRE
jgi:hypothetical protein